MDSARKTHNPELTRERFALLHKLEKVMSGPLSVLGLVWLVVIIVTFVWGNRPWLQAVSVTIWAIFVLDFGIRLLAAPKRGTFLKNNALLGLSLLLPAFAMLRVLRIFALLPAWETALLQLLGSLNRSMHVLGTTMERRGLAYVVALTAVVTLAGAAGMYKFEHGPPGSGIDTYPYAVWWTAMIMTTLGSDYFPHTAPGRILCFLLSVFAFSVFGYVTAAVASYFVNKDAGDERSAVANGRQIEAILREVQSLREELAAARAGG